MGETDSDYPATEQMAERAIDEGTAGWNTAARNASDSRVYCLKSAHQTVR